MTTHLNTPGAASQFRAALGLLLNYLDVENHKPGTKARAIAKAKWEGMVAGIYLLGVTNWAAPTGTELAVMEAVRKAGPVPPFSFTSKNVEYKAWIDNTALVIAKEIFQ